MTATTQLSLHSRHCHVRFTVTACCVSLLLLGGCAPRKVKAKPFPWSTFAYTRPVIPAAAPASGENEDPLEDATLDVEPPPSALITSRAAPPRPRVSVSAAPQADAPSKPEV